MQELPIGTAIGRSADDDPDRPALSHDGRTVTRRELDRGTNRIARAFRDLGVARDDLVTIALPNSIGFYEAAVAVWKLGAIPMPVSPKMPTAEREALVELGDPSLIVGVPDGAHPGRVTLPEGWAPPKEISDAPLDPRVGRSWKAPTSGGSTGRPKIILSGSPGVTQPVVAAVFGIRAGGTVLVPGPLYHNAPFMFSSMALFEGNHLVVMSRFDAAECLGLIEAHRVEWVWFVPTMMNRIMRLDPRERDRYDVSSLDRVWHGAAPCPASVKESFIGWLGPEKVWELYAGTEAQGVTVIDGTDWLSHRGSVGRPIVGDIAIRDADGRDLPPGEVGEIWMRGPDPERPTYTYVGAEARARDGWESIGDMGLLDDDGFLYLADRRTDLIVTGGANVYPAEVEAALYEHPRMRTCAVIGLPDDDLGQIVHAIVETDGDVPDDELRAFLSERLVRYKMPRSFERSDEPLRDEAGKVRRGALRAERMGPARC